MRNTGERSSARCGTNITEQPKSQMLEEDSQHHKDVADGIASPGMNYVGFLTCRDARAFIPLRYSPVKPIYGDPSNRTTIATSSQALRDTFPLSAHDEEFGRVRAIPAPSNFQGGVTTADCLVIQRQFVLPAPVADVSVSARRAPLTAGHDATKIRRRLYRSLREELLRPGSVAEKLQDLVLPNVHWRSLVALKLVRSAQQ